MFISCGVWTYMCFSRILGILCHKSVTWLAAAKDRASWCPDGRYPAPPWMYETRWYPRILNRLPSWWLISAISRMNWWAWAHSFFLNNNWFKWWWFCSTFFAPDFVSHPKYRGSRCSFSNSMRTYMVLMWESKTMVILPRKRGNELLGTLNISKRWIFCRRLASQEISPGKRSYTLGWLVPRGEGECQFSSNIISKYIKISNWTHLPTA